MAKQYTDEVGPWIQFMPVLTDHLNRDPKTTAEKFTAGRLTALPADTAQAGRECDQGSLSR